MKPYVQSSLKVSNRKIVYELLKKVEVTTRAEIGRLTGMSGATVLKIIDYFEANNIIKYEGVDETFTSAGRKPSTLRFNPNFAYIASVYLEGNYASIGIINMIGDVQTSVDHIRVQNFEAFLKKEIIQYIQTLIVRSGLSEQLIRGIGIGLPGIIHPREEMILSAPLLGIEDHYSIKEALTQLRDLFRVPVYVENDVNAAAYGEFSKNYSGVTDDLVYIALGTGVGAGLILDGKIRVGRGGRAGEIGYMCFEPFYRYRQDLPGWLESHIGKKELERQFGNCVWQVKSCETRKKMIHQLAMYLMLVINTIGVVLDVEDIVLGGDVIESMGEELIRVVQESCEDTCLKHMRIQQGKCKQAGLSGLGLLVVERLSSSILKEEE